MDLPPFELSYQLMRNGETTTEDNAISDSPLHTELLACLLFWMQTVQYRDSSISWQTWWAWPRICKSRPSLVGTDCLNMTWQPRPKAVTREKSSEVKRQRFVLLFSFHFLMVIRGCTGMKSTQIYESSGYACLMRYNRVDKINRLRINSCASSSSRLLHIL